MTVRPSRTISALRSKLAHLIAAVDETRAISRETHGLLAEARETLERTHRVLDGEIAVRLKQQERVLLALEATAARIEAHAAVQAERREAIREEVLLGLRRVHAQEAWHRRWLREARTTPEYESAYTDERPLISVLIPTHDRLELLRSRALPSILAQTYENVEIVIVGDGAPYDLDELVRGFEDAPICFVNLSRQDPYPEDAYKRWLAVGTTPFNEAMRLARGAWCAPFADDDEMRPDHLETLLAHARQHRLEFVYGRFLAHLPDGRTSTLGAFPPRMGQVALQAALLHGHLSYFELELADADFGVPNDWARVERLLWAGVRVGMVDDVLVDYFPSARGYAFKERPAHEASASEID